MTRAPEAVLRLFRVGHNRAAPIEGRNAIFPGYVAPVVRMADDGERELVNLNWGFVLLQQGLAPRRVTNVRDDKILTSKFWRPSFEQRRCLVPASSYCEPKGEKPATWHWFAINGDEDRPLFAFPGVWTRYRGPLKKNGENVDQEVFAFMTTEPNALTASINHERMPVLMSDPADFETWLSGSPEDAFKIARSYDAEQMRIVQSGADREDLLRAA
jgi:putative SOS response-associated peptidase YedK